MVGWARASEVESEALAHRLGLASLTLTAAGQSWVQTTSLPDGYAGHSLAYASGFLYQAGGGSNSNGVQDGVNVFYAQVESNGMIGAWNTATPLPEAVWLHAGVAANGFVYVLGGEHYTLATSLYITNTVYYAKINPDGSLGSWQTTTPLPQPVFGLSASAWNNTIYVAGGENDQAGTIINADYSARIQSDGTLSAWVPQSPLPVPNGTTGQESTFKRALSTVCFTCWEARSPGAVKLQTQYITPRSTWTVAWRAGI